MSDESTHVYTEEEIKQIAEMLNSGIEPVSTHELDEVVKLVNITSETLDNVFANKTFGKEDFLALQALWDQAWVVKEHYAAIEEEAKDLRLFDKISLGIKGFKALNKLFKSLKKARA